MTDAFFRHQEQTRLAIRQAADGHGCQPILFIGSGLSRRFFAAPSWGELLEVLASRCPAIEHSFAYYRQKYTSLPVVGSIFSDLYREWAWTEEGRAHFPNDLFESGVPKDLYMKYEVAEYLKSITPEVSTIQLESAKRELDALKKVQPHAIISTNFDLFLEQLFPNYEPVIGQHILRANYVSIGEIFKIHGSASVPDSLVITKEDYDEWHRKKKYLSAKLLTYFAEHPLVFLGYSATDDNIRIILSDIDELLAETDGLVPNLFFVNYSPGAENRDDLQSERLLHLDENRAIRVRNIEADSFEWVFDALAELAPLHTVNPKLLRALLARNYHLVRHDIPRSPVEIDFETLERAASTEGNLAQLLGISTLDNPTAFNATYPHTLTAVGHALGFQYWAPADKLLKRVEREKGVSIKRFDNKYHVSVRVGAGPKSVTHKYSQACIDLLERVKTGGEYHVDATSVATGGGE